MTGAQVWVCFTIVAVATAGVIYAAMVTSTDRAEERARVGNERRRVERACLLATGNARATMPWLEPSHHRREAGLLLLSRDAAWAPLCARDPSAGEALRNRIIDETATPTASRAADLARELVRTLEEGQRP